MKRNLIRNRLSLLIATAALFSAVGSARAADDKKPNVVMLMQDDTGWNDFGCYSGGGAALGHPTPNVDRLAKEGAMFTCWYGQASCTAGRASFITGRIRRGELRFKGIGIVIALRRVGPRRTPSKVVRPKSY